MGVRIVWDNQGIESKQFHVRDGQGIRLWQQSGGQMGIVTGRSSQIVKLRAAELNIEIVRQGVDDKWGVVQAICEQLQLEPAEVGYVGDDLPDLAVFGKVGLSVAGGRCGRGTTPSGRLHHEPPRRVRSDPRSGRVAPKKHESLGKRFEKIPELMEGTADGR